MRILARGAALCLLAQVALMSVRCPGADPRQEAPAPPDRIGPLRRLWRPPQDRTQTPPRLLGLEDVVGKGVWKYDWPDGGVPQEVAGYKLVDSPVGAGQSKANWGRAVVFESQKTGTRVSVRRFRDVGTAKPATPSSDANWPPPCLEKMEFHDLKAGMIATVPNAIAPPPSQTQSSAGTTNSPAAVWLKPETDNRAELVFRLEDDVFGIQATDKTSPENAWAAAKEIGEAVFRQNSKPGEPDAIR
jgi:hypothetical protein